MMNFHWFIYLRIFFKQNYKTVPSQTPVHSKVVELTPPAIDTWQCAASVT